MRDITRADICIAAAAEAWRGAGEIMASPFGTVPMVASRLAKRTFSPDLVREAAVPYKTIFSVVWSGRRHIMMQASQIDRFGNQNLSAIGPANQPKVQLIGVRGAPGNSVNHKTSYWVPDHSTKTFVAAVDTVCGVGYDRAEAAGPGATRFHDLPLVVSNLGVFDFSGPGHTMALRSMHPGVTVDEVIAATGFDLHIGDVVETPLPTDEQLAIIDELDPKGARDREVKA